MPQLTLNLLGPFEATLNNQPLRKFRTTRAQGLLAYLATESALGAEIQRRQGLMGILWPGYPQKSAQINLRQALYHLRNAIPEIQDSEPIPFLLADRQTVQINPEYPLESDVDQFVQVLNGPHEWWAQAVELYRGNFLEDFALDDSEAFEEWAGARRAYFSRQVLDTLSSLATLRLEQGDLRAAEQAARRQIELDNLREIGYRQLMETLARSGRRSEAVATYEELRALVQAELEIEPSEESQSLMESIRAGELEGRRKTTRPLRGYELKQQIGVGSFGVVYRAFQPGVNREVAIKMILARYANDPKFIRRFEREARLIAQLEHPHIVPLYDYWRESDRAHLVMPWLRGGSLGGAIKNGAMDPARVVRIADQIADALAAAHERGVIHRDLKPSNILLDETGNAYLSDFGLAIDQTGGATDSSSGIFGSPAYIAPEQVLNTSVSERTDIYSLGVVLYELLTGQHPFGDESLASFLYKHAHEPLPPVTSLRNDLPQSVDEVIQRASAKDPQERFQNPRELALALRHAVLPGDQPIVTVVAEPQNPYKGLSPFTEADSGRFFGREALVQKLVTRMSQEGQYGRFLALVGPSGSGKSSLVMAGLVPALRRDAIAGARNWFVLDLQPGGHPFEELEAALLRIAVNPPASLLEQLAPDPRGLLRAVKRVLPPGEDHQLLLIIDQFEEVFTQVENPDIRSQFLESLTVAISDPRSPVRVIITLRADFYDRPLMHAGFSDLLRERTEVVVPMKPEELARAVHKPAEQVGVRFERGLVTAIVADVAEQPGGLPLLQYAMTELFERRQGRWLSHAEYQSIGGVGGALGRKAEEVYVSLDASGKAAAQQLFLRLVKLDEASGHTRRRVLRAALRQVEEVGESMDPVIAKFGKARLLSFDRDPRTRGPTVEVAHEALLQEWDRLRKWLEASQADIRTHRVLSRATAEWLTAERDPSFLLRGSRLSQFHGWSQTTSLALSGDERMYLEASSTLSEQERLAEVRSRRRTAIGLAVGLAVMSILAITAGLLWRRSVTAFDAAESQAVIAERRADEAHSLALGAAAEQAFSQGQDDLALALAVEANRIEGPPLQAQTTLYRVAYSPDRNFLDSGVGPIHSVAIGPDGRMALYGETTLYSLRWSDADAGEASLILTDIASRQEIWRRELHAGVESVAFSPDGQSALTGLRDGSLILWAVDTGTELHRFEGHTDLVSSVAFSPDSRTAITASRDRTLILWDLPGRREIRRFERHGGPVHSVAFSPDGHTAISGATDVTMILWDLETGRIAGRPDGSKKEDYTFPSVDFHPAGATILAGLGPLNHNQQPPYFENLILVDVETGAEIHRFGGTSSSVLSAVFSPDGRRALSGLNDGDVLLHDIETGSILGRYQGHSARVTGVAISPDGQLGATVSEDGTVRLWHLSLVTFLDWVDANLEVRAFTCEERQRYVIEPFCPPLSSQQ